MDTVQVSERFRKREFVLEYADNPEYPEYIKFELAQDRCELLDSFQPGQKVRVDLDLNETASETPAPTPSSGNAEETPLPENLGPPNSDEIPF